MISTKFYEKLDPSFNEQIQLLQSNLSNVKNEKEAMEVLQEFSTCYMMPWQLWERYLRMALDVRFYTDNLKHYNFHLPIYQFFYSQKNHFFIRICQKSFKRKMLFTNLPNILKEFNESKSNKTSALIKDVSVLSENLAFPHNHLTEIWHIDEKSLCWSPTKKLKQKNQKMLDLYAKIMSEKNDEDKWIEALAETNDNEFLEHVVEFKIGRDLTNKKLWHVYINYLKSAVLKAKIDYWKEQYTKKLMHTYSKYCRFFLDDEKMLEEYQTAVQTYAGGTVTVPWTNIYAFETYDKYSVVDQVRSRNFIYHQPHVDPLTCYFSPENMAIQTFPFKGPLMYYIQQNADANVISKLKKSCKYFHKRNPIWICYKLRYISHAANEMNRVKYHRQSIEVRSTALFYPDEDLYITTAIEFSADNIDDLSTFIPRLFKCEAKFVSIFYQDLTVEEFKFLTMNVIDLSLHNVRIFCNSTVLYLEEMLESVPNVQYLDVRSIVTNLQTFQKLCNISFQNALYSWKFDFTDINEFNPNNCADFVIKNAGSKFCLNIEFRFANHLQWMNGRQIVSNYETIVNQIIKQQCNEEKMPSFKLTSRF